MAIAVLNAVLGAGTHPGGGFVGRLRQGFVVAINCTAPRGLYSCASMGSGPAVGLGVAGYGLAAVASGK